MPTSRQTGRIWWGGTPAAAVYSSDLPSLQQQRGAAQAHGDALLRTFLQGLWAQLLWGPKVQSPTGCPGFFLLPERSKRHGQERTGCPART